MKLVMNPTRAYILGLWKGRKTKEGVGVEGSQQLCEVFIKICLDEGFAQPNKIKYDQESGKKCYFYNSAVRAWLQQELEKRQERLKYKNEFAASYFAGLFDSTGGVLENEKICYFEGDATDEIVLLRLGFRVKKEKGKLVVFGFEFCRWISPYLKIRKVE
ncbi:MAG: hypothetical protein QXT25_01080 [Candidatus Anstonellaceae archaeon]